MARGKHDAVEHAGVTGARSPPPQQAAVQEPTGGAVVEDAVGGALEGGAVLLLEGATEPRLEPPDRERAVLVEREPQA